MQSILLSFMGISSKFPTNHLIELLKSLFAASWTASLEISFGELLIASLAQLPQMTPIEVDKESRAYHDWKKMMDDISRKVSGTFSAVNYQMIEQFARGGEEKVDEVGEFRPIDIDSFDVVSDGETSAIVEKSDGMDELDNMINGVAVDADSLEKRSLDELDKMFFDGAYDYDNGGKSMRR